MTALIDRVVLVTGAASGIGAATARRLAAPGSGLVLTTRSNAAGLAAVAHAVRARGGVVDTVIADLANSETAAMLVERTRAAFGRIDQIVSNAGHADKRPFGSFAARDLDDQLTLHARSFAALVDAALPDLQRTAWGRVVAIGSFVAHDIGINGTIFPTTAAAKAALEALARTLAFQLAPSGTTVNVVAPGYTRKESTRTALDRAGWEAAVRATPTGRLAEPDDVAAAIAFLLSREARQITGQILRVDGGLSLA
ncbi:MAG: SDR family NAD(P)-dependent oxidoreductase [Pseudomonadota bacterium]